MTKPKPPTRPEHRIEYRPLSSIRADPRNPKAHEVGVIDGSMRRFGFIEPIVVDDRTGMLISGHGRTETLTAMHAAGEPPPAGVRVAGDDWEVPVTVGWASADDVEASGALITLNRAGEVGGWVDQSLLDSLDRLRDTTGLDGIGYGDEDIALLAGRVADQADADEWGSGSRIADPDAVPPLPPVPFSREGDVWVLGPHRLVCGDCTKGEVWDALLSDGKTPNAVWTDPPYGVAYVGGTRDALTIENDERDPEKLRVMLNVAFGFVKARCSSGSPVYVASPAGPLNLIFTEVLVAHHLVRQGIIWVKDQFVMGGNDYHYRHELLFVGYTPDKRPGRVGRGGPRWVGPDNADSVLEIPRPRANKEHPTMKPVELVTTCLRNHAPETGRMIVADPFAGSGTTLIAAEALGAHARLIELDPQYVDVICRRYQEATGTLPTRNGKPHDFTTD